MDDPAADPEEARDEADDEAVERTREHRSVVEMTLSAGVDDFTHPPRSAAASGRRTLPLSQDQPEGESGEDRTEQRVEDPTRERDVRHEQGTAIAPGTVAATKTAPLLKSVRRWWA